MNDSRVEKLLQQMSLKEPSANLDDWVGEIAHQTEPVRAVRPGQQVARKLLSAVAVACLLVGVVIGRATATKAVAAEVAESDSGHTDKAAAERMWSPKNRSSRGKHVLGTAEDVKLAVASFEWPQVAKLCSLGIGSVPASDEARCLKCHSGVPEQESKEAVQQFRGGYVQDFHRQLCSKCHEMGDNLEHLDLKEISRAIYDQPWHKVQQEDSPAG
ncbi:MAG TPA: hypothetical protein EYQ63_18000 [Fuerstia sp.]|nr:hypothetical protein [Fuerstiella sp.]